MSLLDWTNFAPGVHRISCPHCGTKPNKRDMGVTVFDAGYGVAHCYKCGARECSRSDRVLTSAERKAFALRMDALRQQHQVEQRLRQASTAAEAVIRWSLSTPAAEHPYAERKHVLLHGLRVDAAGHLLVPLRDTAGRLWNLQSIAADGTKRFMPGGRVKGLYHSIGRPGSRLLIAEGYATGATLHEQSGDAVAVAFDAGNLLPVAKAVRAKFPRMALVVAADDDWRTDGNPGLSAATEAARAVGGLVAVPDFAGLRRGEKDSDFNDFARLARGVSSVSSVQGLGSYE